MSHVKPASHFADFPAWDEAHFVAQDRGHILWQTARHTSRGGSIRLMRLDNKTLKVTRAYVSLDTPMRLVRK